MRFEAYGPKLVDSSGSPALPMVSEDTFIAFFAAPSLLRPKSESPFAGQPLVRWSYVIAAQAAAAFWRVVRGLVDVFGHEWSPLMGVIRNGLNGACA